MCNEIICLNIAVCDDETFVLDVVGGAISKAFDKKTVKTKIFSYSDLDDFENALDSLSFDLIFLDIDMKERNGIDLAKKLRNDSNNVSIIFVSNREDLVFDSLKVHPFGFVRKSNFLSDIMTVIDSFCKYYQSTTASQGLVANSIGGEKIFVPIDDILYIDNYKKNQFIHVLSNKEPYEIRSTMNQLEKELKDKGFCRTHKCYIISFRQVRSLTSTDMVLTSGERIPISKSMAKDVKKQYLDFLHNNNSSML